MEVWDFRIADLSQLSSPLHSWLCFSCANKLSLFLLYMRPWSNPLPWVTRTRAAQQVPPGLRTEPNKRIPLTFQTGSENRSKALRNQPYVELQKVAPETLEPWSLVSGNPTHLPPTAQTEAAKTGSSFNSQPTFQNTDYTEKQFLSLMKPCPPCLLSPKLLSDPTGCAFLYSWILDCSVWRHQPLRARKVFSGHFEVLVYSFIFLPWLTPSS